MDYDIKPTEPSTTFIAPILTEGLEKLNRGTWPTKPSRDGYIVQNTEEVLLLYSLQTPSQELARIHGLLVGGLRERHGISVHTPDIEKPRELSTDWIEREVEKADTVFLVCNKQFLEEWSSSPSLTEGHIQMGYAVNRLKDNFDLKKFAYVYFEEDKNYRAKMSKYIPTEFCIKDNVEEVLDSIARFTRNVPKFHL